MSHTRKKGYDERGNLLAGDTETRSFYSRERKWARKSTNRKNRNATREALRTIDDPDTVIVERPPSTGGWITH